MTWQIHRESAKSLLQSTLPPSSHEIIELIKKVNPTSLDLPEPDREHGYQLKHMLQNLLLENYGEAFLLVPHPCNPDTVLIKHRSLPVDACHALLKTLSPEALAKTDSPLPAPLDLPAAKGRRKEKKKSPPAPTSQRELLKRAEQLLDQYDYPQAEELLRSIRIEKSGELSILLRAAGLLLDEVGSFSGCIDTCLAQPREVLRERSVRELLALAYYKNGMVPEARALYDALHAAELGKESLLAYADIALRDGNMRLAYNLLQLAEQKEGFAAAFGALAKEIDARMLLEAGPVLHRAEAAFEAGDFVQAEALAHEALQHCPKLQKARDLLLRMERLELQAEIAELYERLARCERPEERIPVLIRLSGCDKENKAQIEARIAAEKERQKSEMAAETLASLRLSVERRNWPEAFDLFWWLSRQEEQGDHYLCAVSLSPFFSLLHQSKQLQRLPEQLCKQQWLSFIEADALLESGNQERCLNRFRKLKPYLEGCPLFEAKYGRLLQMEQDKATAEVRKLLEQARESCSLDEATAIYASVRKAWAILPAQQRAGYTAAMEEVIQRLKPRREEELLIAEYRDARMTGKEACAAALREKVIDKGRLDLIDRQIMALFQIDWEPVTLTVSPDLAVDFDRDSPPVTYLYATSRHVVLGEDEETIIVLDLLGMHAARYRSPVFKGVEIYDDLAKDNIFLFRSTGGEDTLWRATLCGAGSRFTASFKIREKFFFESCFEVENIYMSAASDDEYYCHFRDPEGRRSPRIERQTIGCQGSRARYEANSAGELVFCRVSPAPEKFLIGTDSCLRISNKNLGTHCKGLAMPAVLYGIDEERGQIYLLQEPVVTVIDANAKYVTAYPHSCGAVLFDYRSVVGIAPESEIIVVALPRGCCLAYNMRTNLVSRQFKMNLIICAKVPSTFYYLEFAGPGSSEITIRDITHELEDLLEWYELFEADEDWETFCLRAAKLFNRDEV